MPQKASACYQAVLKAPVIAQNSYPLKKKKAPQKLQFFLKIEKATVGALKTPQKSFQRAPAFWRNSNHGTALIK